MTAQPEIAIDATCLDCGAEVMRTEVAPGEDIRIPGHACDPSASVAPASTPAPTETIAGRDSVRE